jgi:purine-binding chemotaxis protein CheW
MSNHYVVFILDGLRYGLDLSAVDRVVHIVNITPLVNAPPIVLGIVNVRGRVIPVFNIRKRFFLPEKEIALTDQLIVANTGRRRVALVVDRVADVIRGPQQELIAAQHILPDLEHVEGIVKHEDGLILIHDLDKFLSLEEEQSLARALENN